MLKKYPFIQGTLILTFAGVLTRIIGFFYRIFLARFIGEEGLGIYQLMSPVMSISFALTCSGIQTSISKYVASYHAKNDSKGCFQTFVTGFLMSLFLSICVAYILFQNNLWIAKNLLFEERCHALIRLFALSLPFSCLHSCINGYYYGMKKTILPSSTQLLEQIARVGSVYVIYLIATANNRSVSFAVAMIGNIIGEIVSSLVSLIVIYVHFGKIRLSSPLHGLHLKKHGIEITKMAFPLMANRLVLNGLQSLEAIYIPTKLMAYGMSNKEALSSYGVLTGMTLPLLLFPTALTSSVSLLLLPYISEAQTQNRPDKIKSAIKKCVTYCVLLGSVCCIFLLATGNFLGSFLFHSDLASVYIRMFCITCPTLYVSNVLTSILHGLGKTFTSFVCQCISLIIRLLFVFFLIPVFGMSAYILGVFVSQIIFTFCMLWALYHFRYRFKSPQQVSRENPS